MEISADGTWDVAIRPLCQCTETVDLKLRHRKSAATEDERLMVNVSSSLKIKEPGAPKKTPSSNPQVQTPLGVREGGGGGEKLKLQIIHTIQKHGPVMTCYCGPTLRI